MAYIVPDSTIILLTNVPIQPNYSDTLYFTSASEQTNYFLSKTLRRFDAQYYQRHTINKCRLNARADDVDMCNYMMFQNTAFQGKWFYAFITSVEYINVNVAEITFEIDQLQSWYFEYSTMPCFVERMHNATDNIGDNIVPENINCGEYVANGNFTYIVPDLSQQLVICLLFSSIASGSSSAPATSNYDYVYSTGNIYLYHNTVAGRQALQLFLTQYASQFASVLALYMIPIWCIGPTQQNFTDGDILVDFVVGQDRPVVTCTIANLSGTETLDGHTVRNNKLFTYPYNFLHIDNCQDIGMNLRYEFFADSPYLNFIQMGNVLPPVSTVLYPVNYKNSAIYYNESVGISNYPQCPVAIDAYALWFTQNLIPDIIKLGGGAFGGVANGSTGGAVGNTIGGISNIIASGVQSSLQGDVVKGNTQNGNLASSNSRLRYEYVRMSVNAMQAKVIDDYFTAYGYAQNQIMLPRNHTRTRFTYIKTRGCTIKGSLPNEAISVIQNIYDNGIRFWADKDQATVLNMLPANNVL